MTRTRSWAWRGARRCRRSLAGRQRLGPGEAAGRASRSAQRPQWLAGLAGHDCNCCRHRDAEWSWKQVCDCQLQEGLRLRFFCMRPCSVVMPAPLNGRSALARVHRSRYLWTKVVVERRGRMHRRGLLAKLSAALRQLELAGYDAGSPRGYIYAAGASEKVFYCARFWWCFELRTRA